MIIKSLAVTIILAASILLLVAGIIEKWMHRRNLRAIPIRILVNGTRGKTSVTRLIAAVLREAGYRTWAKTTGTQAAWILPDATECEYRKKWKPVNIREQIPFMRRARKDGAQAVVVECMALHPENQLMMASELVRPSITVITNARVDHISEIGATEEETVATLALSIPKDASAVCDDPRFDEYTTKRVDSTGEEIDDGYVESFAYPMFEDNVRQTLAVARLLKIDRETALRGMLKALPDIGMRGPFQVGECLVINAFACNDYDSARVLLDAAIRRYDLKDVPLWILFNNRGDREFRLNEFNPMMQTLSAEGAKLRIIGENRAKVAHYFAKKAHAQAEVLNMPVMEWFESLSGEKNAVLCLGNIRDDGKETIEALEARGGKQ